MIRIIKYYIIYILIFAAYCTLLYSENPRGLVFDKKSHNFGKARQNDRITTIFHYTNKTGKVLQIKKVKTSCGCTAANTTKKILNPNDFGEIVITFNTGRRSGITKKFITFQTSPPLQPPPRISIQANIVPDIYMEPERMINIKLPADNTPVNKSVKILSAQHTNFRIENITYDSNSIKVTMNKYINTNQNIYGYILDITLFPEPIKKKTKSLHFFERIKIKTSLKNQKYLSLNIQGQIQ